LNAILNIVLVSLHYIWCQVRHHLKKVENTAPSNGDKVLSLHEQNSLFWGIFDEVILLLFLSIYNLDERESLNIVVRLNRQNYRSFWNHSSIGPLGNVTFTHQCLNRKKKSLLLLHLQLKQNMEREKHFKNLLLNLLVPLQSSRA